MVRSIQVGGPLGGFIGPQDLDAPLTFEALRELGADLGHGSLIALDERVDRAALERHFWGFAASESCGTCAPCRLGTRRGLERAEGRGDPDVATRIRRDARGDGARQPVRLRAQRRAGRSQHRARLRCGAVRVSVDGTSVDGSGGLPSARRCSGGRSGCSLAVRRPAPRPVRLLPHLHGRDRGARGPVPACTTPATEGAVVRTDDPVALDTARARARADRRPAPRERARPAAGAQRARPRLPAARRRAQPLSRRACRRARRFAPLRQVRRRRSASPALAACGCATRCRGRSRWRWWGAAPTRSSRPARAARGASPTASPAAPASTAAPPGRCRRPGCSTRGRSSARRRRPAATAASAARSTSTPATARSRRSARTARRPVNRGHACVKGRFAHGFVRSPDRLTHAPDPPRTASWSRPSWEEALGHVGGRAAPDRRPHGPDAIAAISSARATNEENYLMQKLMRVAIGTNNVDNCARICHAPSAAGLVASFGLAGGTNPFEDFDRAGVFLLCGSNPTEAHPVVGARIKQRVIAGARLVVVDPRAHRARRLRRRPPAPAPRHQRRRLQRARRRADRGGADRRAVHRRAHRGLRGAARAGRRLLAASGSRRSPGCSADDLRRAARSLRRGRSPGDRLGARGHRARPRDRRRARALQPRDADRQRRHRRRLRRQSAARAEQRPGRLRHGRDARHPARLPEGRRPRGRGPLRRRLGGPRSGPSAACGSPRCSTPPSTAG